MAKKPTNPYVSKSGEHSSITPEGYEYLEDAVTDPTGNVYGFKDLGPTTVAAAMARLSRRGDDMRITILDEFTEHSGRDEDLLRRVITAFGDDSVQQLVGQHFVVEGASNLLTKQLEWGRLAAYLEQSTRYIYFDKKDEDGKYKYFTPDQLPENVRKEYEASMNTIFDRYSSMVHSLSAYLAEHSSTPEDERDGAWRSAIRAQACDAIRPVLPVATKSTVGIFASAQAIENLIMRLQASDSQEARQTGEKVLTELRKVIPTFLERADKPERGGATVAYFADTRNGMRDLTQELLGDNETKDTEPVILRSVWPENELELLPEMLYEHSNLSLDEITKILKEAPEDEKLKVFKAYFGERLNRRHRPGRALETAHYSFDLVCDYGIFRDLQRHRMVDDLEWQALTPELGHEVPTLVEEAGLKEEFDSCFDESKKLYNFLQSNGATYESQYATLLGHKMRWKMTINAREAFHLLELRTGPQGHPGYRKLSKQMFDEIAKLHPLIAAGMIFINKDEDPELTRLAAEKATQFKLQKLDENRQ